MAGLFEGGFGQTEVRPYNPTWQDRLGGLLADWTSPDMARRVVGSAGAGRAGPVGGAGLLDMTPVGGLFALDEFGRGDTLAAAGAIPVPGARAAVPSAKAAVDAVTKRGDEILGMLRGGRAKEVTDEMLVMPTPIETARLNAYLYDNYDLPMDEASRVARARQSGFDTEIPLYHGTDVQLDGFSTEYQRDPGFWFTSNRLNAAQYAHPEGGLHRVYTRTPNNKTYTVDWDEYGEPFFTDAPEYMDNAEVVSDAFSSGADTVTFPQGNLSESDYTRVVRSPADIRSTDARFDPRLSHLRNLSAGVGGGLLGTGALLGSLADPQQAQARGLLGYHTGGGF